MIAVRRLVAMTACAGAALVAAEVVASPPARTPLGTSAVLAAGKATYEGSAAGCFACHGLTGEGNGPVAFFLKPPPRNFVKDPFKGGETVEQVFATVTNGLSGTQMAPYGKLLTDDERWAVAYYVLSFRKKP